MKILCGRVLIPFANKQTKTTKSKQINKKDHPLGRYFFLKMLRVSVFKVIESKFKNITIPESGDHLLFVFVPAHVTSRV